jgi:hypothetical protein
MPTEYWYGEGDPVSPSPPVPCECEDEWEYNVPPIPAIPLYRYAKLIEYDECSFFGVQNPDIDWPTECRRIWVKRERDMVLKYLLEAQEELENVVGYPLNDRWFTTEQRPYSFPLKTKWKKVIEGGVVAVSDIAIFEAIDHSTDPAVVGPISTTVTDKDEIHVYHPCTSLEIHPSKVTLSGGSLTIEIPRCRLVTEDAMDNEAGGLIYTNLTNFLGAVDVKRVYNDPSTNATLIWPHACTTTSTYCGCSCSEYTQTACIYVKNGELGFVDVVPASYSGGSWSCTCATCCGEPHHVLLNYRAGLTELGYQAEDAILRLAHAKMPAEPCSCDIMKRIWQRDRNVPEVLTRERLNCPFGLSDGAWIAWKFSQALKIHRGAVL